MLRSVACAHPLVVGVCMRGLNKHPDIDPYIRLNSLIDDCLREGLEVNLYRLARINFVRVRKQINMGHGMGHFASADVTADSLDPLWQTLAAARDKLRQNLGAWK
jgi:hypothetical protein